MRVLDPGVIVRARERVASVVGGWPVPAIAVGASAFMLAAAHAFERLGGLAPCALCLQQRDVYWAALVLGGAALAAGRLWPDARLQRVAAGVLGVCFVIGALIAGYHAGVEWKWWPGPASCSGGGQGGMSAASVLDALTTPQRAVPCDQAAWRMFGLSMAGYNALISLGLAALAGRAVLTSERSEAFE